MNSENKTFGKFSNKSLVVLKSSLIIAALIGLVVFIASAGNVFADHTSSVTIDPVWTTCGASETFTVTVANTGGDPVNEVRIYNNTNAAHTNFACGLHPTNWTLVDQTGTYSYCQYQTDENNPARIDAGESLNFTFSADITTECNYSWEVRTYDINLAWQPHYPQMFVDCTPPNTTKWYEDPKKIVEGPKGIVKWISLQTLIHLDATDDVGPHDSGINETWYKNVLVEVEACWDPSVCEFWFYETPNGEWQLYEGPFNKTEESCHLLKYYSIDNMGNVEDIKYQCFFVDNTPPVGTKEVGDPKIPLCDVREVSEYDELTEGQKGYGGDLFNFTEELSGYFGWDPLKITKTTKTNGDVEFKIEMPRDLGQAPDNFDLVFDADADGEPDWLVHWYYDENGTGKPVWPGVTHWAFKDGHDPTGWLGKWGNYQALPSWITAIPDSTGKTFYITIDGDHLGGCGSEYRYAMQAPLSDEGYPESWTGEVVVIKYPLGVGNEMWTDSSNYHVNYVGGLKDWWVRDHVTQITLDCVDPEPHPVDQETVCYNVSFDLDPDGYVTDEYCNEFGGTMEGEWCCAYVGDKPYVFNFTEDSLHDLEFYCRDHLGNTEEVHEVQYYKVDSIPPNITKEMFGNWTGDCPPEDEFDECYVADDGTSGVNITVEDGGEICAVDEVECYYELVWYNPDPILVDSGNFSDHAEIIFYNDSTHVLFIHCEDALGNYVEDWETFLVDSKPPVTTKTYGDPTKVVVDERWITSSTPINLTAVDEKVGVDYIKYRYCLDPDCYENNGCDCEGEEWIIVYDDEEIFTIPDDSEHCIEYYAVDKFGYEETVKSQCVYVDNIPPTVNKTVGDPKINCTDLGYGDCEYFVRDHETPIYLTCEDQGPHPVEQETAFYKIYLDGENITGWLPFGGAIYFEEDSLHTLEYYCEDHLGNGGEHHNQTYRVDSTPPIINKTVIGPQVGDCPPEEPEDECWIRDNVTEINITAEDPEVNGCVVGLDKCYWWYYLDGERHPKSGVYDYKEPIIFSEDSNHTLHIKCKDLLGNEIEDVETFYVDSTPPETEKWYEGPQYSESEYPKWISSETEVHLNATDNPEVPCAVGVNKTWYLDILVSDENCWDPETYCDPIYEEEIEFCVDTCYEHWEEMGLESWEACVEFCIQYEAIEISEEFSFYTEPFTKDEESCHLIQYFSVDELGNVEDMNVQCVFVDNTGPNTTKEVGEPKTEWDGKDAYFYDIADKCWNESSEEYMECWKVTTLTPISLDCLDPEPHPVDNEHVCFKIDLDGEDATEEYCDSWPYKYSPYNGKMTDGFCCVDQIIEEFYFEEETEHNLKYYCVDALENEGPIDEEKFKVEGTKFEIPLFKKWNLISVPFVLLNDTPEEVFKDISDDIDSVWTYDGETSEWYVWSPNPSPDNLKIKPGWGYWVLAKNGTTENPLWLTIGGSLFNPVTIPPSKNLVKGWNLIGYYGTSWELYEWGDFNFVCGDAFNYPDKFIYGDKVYCALNSLIDTQEGYPKWSGVWSYINCGNHQDAWLGLNACADQSLQQLLDRMYAGRGYWVEMDVEDIYSPATTCIWNSDFECRWTGGGILP